MRNLTSAFTFAAGSALLAATATFAAPADGHTSDHLTAGGHGTAAYAPQVPMYGYGYPAMSAPVAYGSVWAGYKGESAPVAECGCGHCCKSKKFSVRKLVDKFSSGMDRLLKPFAGDRHCHCACGAAENERSCAADSPLACDAIGPAYLPAPPSVPLMPMVPTAEPVPTGAPSLEQLPSEPSDPFVDDPAASSARRLRLDGPGYFQR